MSSQQTSQAALSPETKHGQNKSEDNSITWDEFYDDPNADLVLVSSDRVGFKVEARVFAKKR